MFQEKATIRPAPDLGKEADSSAAGRTRLMEIQVLCNDARLNTLRKMAAMNGA